ncbi:MAG: hypothetical protein ACRDQU_06870 [Pseudonocardiaceae bacterium]
MAGRGPVPKARRSRKADEARRDAEMVKVATTGALAGRPLPKGVLPEGESWHPQTLALWAALRRSPLLADEPPLGWQFLIDTALMHHVMWSKGRWEYASEVRLRVAKFGATPEDRMRLKVRVVQPAAEVAASGNAVAVTDIASRRARLTESLVRPTPPGA